LIARNGSLSISGAQCDLDSVCFREPAPYRKSHLATVLRRIRHIRLVWRRTARRTPKCWSSPRATRPK